MKIAAIAARTIFIACLPIFLFTASIAVAFNCSGLYNYGFGKYDISAVTGIAAPELNRVARDLISYWNSGEEYIEVVVEKEVGGPPFALFNEREMGHLKDVKTLVKLDYSALTATGLFCVAYAVAALWYRRPAYRRDLAVAGFWGGILSLGILVVVGVSALADFGGFWTQFHLLSFSNDLWLLDPSKDYLIMMFPEGFWADSMMVVAGLTAFLALVTCGLSWFYLKRASVACQSVEPTPTP